MKVSSERKTAKRNSKAQKKSRVTTPVSSKKREWEETSINERKKRCRKNLRNS
jgi:hypothetical protein